MVSDSRLRHSELGIYQVSFGFVRERFKMSKINSVIPAQLLRNTLLWLFLCGLAGIFNSGFFLTCFSLMFVLSIAYRLSLWMRKKEIENNIEALEAELEQLTSEPVIIADELVAAAKGDDSKLRIGLELRYQKDLLEKMG